MRSKRIVALLMCGAMLFSGILTACNPKNDDTQATAVASADEATPDETASVTDEKTDETKPQKETQPATKATNEKKKPDTKKETTPTEPSYTVPVSSDPKTCIVTVANKNHTVKVGSVITYTCYMKTPDKVEDVQAKVNYTGSALSLVDKTSTQLFPVLGNSAVCNTGVAGVMKYNAINLDGYDFTTKGALVTMKFKVLQSSSASIYSTVEYVTGVEGVPFIDNCKVVKDVNVTLEETLS